MPAATGKPTGLILSGGMALGAYQHGALDVLLASAELDLRALAATSIGAFNGAIIAGNAPEERLPRLEAFWAELISDRPAAWFDIFGFGTLGPVRHAANWLNVAAVRVSGNPPLFRPRGLAEPHESHVPSLYMPDRARQTLFRYVDFERLNDGPVRFCCAATDIETGECVIFDTAAGDRITPDHIIASGSLIPAMPPTRIGDRLLVDGGFTANALLEPFLASDRVGEPLPVCVLLDLFPPDAPPPRSLEKAAERSTDLKFACQTELRLRNLQRERALELQVPGRDQLPGTDCLYLRCHGQPEDTGSEKAYNFSEATLADRRRQGADDARKALALELAERGAPGLRVHRI